MQQNKNNGNRGVNKKALFLTIAFLAFIIIITAVGASSLFRIQAEEGTEEGREHREDVLYVKRQGGTAVSQRPVAQPTILPDDSGMDEAVSFDTEESGWTAGMLENKEYRYDILVVLEFTNLKAQPLEALLYDEDKTVIYEPSVVEDGRIVFKAERFKKGIWYLATKLPEGETSLGTSVVSYLTEEEYDNLFHPEEKEPLARDEFGGAITE